MNGELKNLFTGLTQNPGLEKIDVSMKNEAVKILFSEITDDTVGTEDKMTICFTKKFSPLLALLPAIRETTLNEICRQSVKWSNLFLLLIK